MNLANRITLIRIFLVPIMMFFLLVKTDYFPAIHVESFAVTGLRQIALLEGAVVAASKWGKIKTAAQITAIILMLLNNFPFEFIGFRFDEVMLWVAALVTVYSGIDYFVKNKNVLHFADKKQ